MTDYTPENLTDDQIINLLQMLFTNMNNLDRIYYDLFINPVPMDVTLERYDENGTLHTFILPNRAKDKTSIYMGQGNPEGILSAKVGAFYFDTTNRDMYYKGNQTERFGWTLIRTAYNFRAGYEYVAPTGDGSGLQNLNANNINAGILSQELGGTGTSGLNGIIKGNGSLNPFSVAIADVDYALPTSYVGMIGHFAGTVAPTGWLVADGQAVSRTTYNRLFNAIGTLYGDGDGSTTFNVPNLVGRFAEGSIENVGTYVEAGLPNHQHAPLTISGSNDDNGDPGDLCVTHYGQYNGQHQIRDSYTGNVSNNSIYGKSDTVQPASLKLLPCIKY